MEQIDIQNTKTVSGANDAPTANRNDGIDEKVIHNSHNSCITFQFVMEKDEKDITTEQVKKDLLIKADEFFNSGCAKVDHSLSESQNLLQEVFLGLESEQMDYESNLLKYCVAMDVDGDMQVSLEQIENIKEELNALEYRSCRQSEPNVNDDDDDGKPSYSEISSLDMDSAEGIERLLNLPPFDPHEPQVRFIVKRALSLNKISCSKDNVIQMLMPMKCVGEYMKTENFNPMTEFLNTFAKHQSDEFCTFCSCKECISYREIAIHIMMEQFKASHMIVLLLDALIKAYSPLLRNATAFNGFEKLLENNKDIYWIASGLIYNKKYEHLDLIYDETLTDPMILVLFSSILMVNNPMQLLQILSFHIKCIIKAFAVGICEVPAEEKLAYIIDGFDNLCLISEQVASHLFIFEKYFLNKFSLSWVCLCQRLFHQHVYMKFFVAITNSGESLKNDDPLKNRYFDFAKRIICTDMRWNRAIWPKLQRYNLSDIEVKRRKCMLRVHHLFDAVVEDALRLPLEESSDDNLFYDIHSLENRRLAWQNIMAFAKMKWPDGFFNAPNTLVLDFRCEKCGAINEQHESKCKCVTCSIGGDPFLPPSKMKNICLDCLLKQRKVSDESQQNAESSSSAANETDDEDLKDLLCGFIGSKRSKDRSKHLTSNISKMGVLERFFEGDISDLGPEDPYHISWATFKHLSQRERYIHSTVDEKYFCRDCHIPVCMLARKLLNNEISPELTAHLVSHFHPLALLQHELRALLPNIVYYNQRFISTKKDSNFHNVVVKAYWTFIVSLYTTYFFDFETPSPLNLRAFEIDQSDIKLIPEKLTGNKEDTKFLEFLAAIRRLFLSSAMAENIRKLSIKYRMKSSIRKIFEELIKSKSLRQVITEKDKTDLHCFFVKLIYSFAPADGGGDPALILEYLQRDDVKQQLDSFLKSHEDRRRKILSMIKVSQTTATATPVAVTTQSPCDIEPSVSCTTAVTLQPTGSNSMPEVPALPLSDHQQKKICSSKPKKCCLEHAADLGAEHCKDNHAGKKRLKKDCSHARINETRDRLRKKLQNARKDQQQQMQQQQQIKSQAMQQQIPPKQLQHSLKTQSKSEQLPMVSNQDQNINSTSNPIQQQQQPNVKSIVETSTLLMTSDLIYDAHGASNMDTDKNDSDGNETLLPNTPPPPIEELLVSNSTERTEKSEKVIGKVMEICDMIDNNKLKMKKWIDETLTYIEGYATTSSPSAANSNKRSQPQTKNPKKAAKKAKQKLRKEEEKRIGELHELRAQFQDIYFKEFVEKIELKSLKSNGIHAVSKRRCDKKKIADIEANIKKLQRAKSKLEGNILELIATVKQTNTEFKFPYLPTKEQQQAKLNEIENSKFPTNLDKQSTPPPLSLPPANSEMTNNSFDYAAIASTKFFPNISFPYEMSFPGGAIQQNPVCLGYNNGANLPQSTMCYAPPQQQLSTNVMSAFASNPSIKNKATTESCADPSKRIVTIRRVHNPNLADSQVTVTARGNSPHEDKLLYTFINGQLVPTNGTLNVDSSRSNGSNSIKTEFERETNTTAAPLTKSQLKKERRRQAKLGLTQETASNGICDSFEIDEREQTKDAREKEKSAKKKSKLTEKPEQKPNSKSTLKVSTNSSQTKLTKGNIDIQEAKLEIKTNIPSKKEKRDKRSQQSSVDSKNSQKQQQQPDERGSKSTRKVLAKKVEKQSISSINGEIAPSHKQDRSNNKEQRRNKLINHGQFDNNPYKTLHMQDSDSELDVTASSCDEDSVCSDIVETNNCDSSKFKSKLKQQKPTTTTTQSNNKINCNNVLSKSIIQNHKPSNTTVSTENKSITKSNVDATKDEKRSKPNAKKVIKEHTASKDKNKDPGNFVTDNKRSKQNENGNRKDLNRDNVSKQEKQERNEISYSSKNAISNIYQQRTTQRNNKSSTSHQSPTALTLPKNKSMSIPTSSSALKANTHLAREDVGIPVSKRAQRAKKRLEQQQQKLLSHHTPFQDCGAGIPARMEHFNPNDVNAISQRSYVQQQPQLENLTRQFQGLQMPRDNMMPSYASVSASKSSLSGQSLSTVSIMDQLNRGVQVENLSLPPGITLTKVDPIKSEQLRQKSESIKRLSQPLQAKNHNMPIIPGAYQHHGSAIIAPPTAGYMPTQYIQPRASISGAVPLDQGNIIMVESIPTKPAKANCEILPNQSSSSGKASSKSKRRRNKGKRAVGKSLDGSTSNPSNASSGNEQPKMITLRNPMFHAGPASAAATILQQPNLMTNRQGFSGENCGVSYPASLPVDQPAAIIKNENGMFTIRNPALHQAVTNGLALSGYRQFGGNVSYYTPQEATRTAQKHQNLMQKARVQATSGPTESFSYFSDNPINNVTTNVAGPTTVSVATSPTKPSNKISITCAGVEEKNIKIDRNRRRDTVQFDIDNPTASSMSRPSSAQRCISAIGSEVKNNRSSTNVDLLRSEYNQSECLSRSHENLSSSSTSMVLEDNNKSSSNTSAMLQDKYQQSSYYNGFDVFPPQSSSSSTNHISTANSTPAPTPALGRSTQTAGVGVAGLHCSSNSLFETSIDPHIHHHSHHSCGDDSPPPTNLLGYSSSYLDDIPNTGVIRYDDASFLKNLIPGQRLNKEVSIHNISESNQGRTTSPMPHLVEITPVYSGSNKVSQTQELQSNLQHRYNAAAAAPYTNAYQKNYSEFDSSVFPKSSNNYLNLSKSDANEAQNITGNVECEQPLNTFKVFNYEFETPTSSVVRQESITDLNNVFSGGFASNHRGSPYLDDTTMDSFVQNLNELQIGSSANRSTEQCSQQQLNGESGRDSALVGNTSNSNSTNSTPASGWW